MTTQDVTGADLFAPLRGSGNLGKEPRSCSDEAGPGGSGGTYKAKAHQRLIRERKAAEGGGDNLFGAWWSNIDNSIEKADLREVDLRTAAKVITEYEYLGTMPNAPLKAYAIYWGGAIGGVIVFGAVSPPSVAKSIMPNEHSGRVIQLARGACVHWAHPHAASKLIAYGLKQIEREGWRVAIAYSDERAGEIGTVYQATNWLYCGKTAIRPDYCDASGNVIMGPVGEIKPWMTKQQRPRKGRYAYIMGTKRERRELLKLMAWPVEPYPKRNASEVSREIRPALQQEGRGANSTTTLHFSSGGGGAEQAGDEEQRAINDQAQARRTGGVNCK